MKSLWRSRLLALGIAFAAGLVVRADEPGIRKSVWNGFERLDFAVAGRPCLLVKPARPAPGNPWIWRTEFFGHEPQADLALLAHGWHLAFMDARDMYGAPPAMALFGSFYAHLVANYGLARRVVLEGFSRGGLYAFNFAVAHPTRVAALYLDAPVLDIRSWSGRNRASKEWLECLAIYRLTEETAGGFKGNPLDHVALVARAGVPIIAVCGGADAVVPFAQNTAILEQRYRELGGTIEVILKPGGDHHPHSLKDPTPIVNFLLGHARL
ncbi:MAG: alpha/beta hydrolase [Opitutaceae bacterium]|nr:alpha/beta hydrolase [Opitutaceae bacterium]